MKIILLLIVLVIAVIMSINKRLRNFEIKPKA